MARYIDADALIETLQGWREDSAMCDGSGNPVDSILYDVIRYIEDTPTADVAPRAEVAREILEEIMSEIQRRCLVVDGLSERSDEEEYYTGCSDAYGRIGGYILGLKEKYTEETP